MRKTLLACAALTPFVSTSAAAESPERTAARKVCPAYAEAVDAWIPTQGVGRDIYEPVEDRIRAETPLGQRLMRVEKTPYLSVYVPEYERHLRRMVREQVWQSPELKPYVDREQAARRIMEEAFTDCEKIDPKAANELTPG